MSILFYTIHNILFKVCLLDFSLFDCKDWTLVGFGFLTTVFWALIVYSLKPNLKIHQPELSFINERPVIKIPIENCSLLFRVTRIQLETAILENGFTYHLKTDMNDFAFIPTKKKGDNKRIFTAYRLSEFLTECYPHIPYDDLIKSKPKIRIRIHATHPFSGLGKCFEEIFPLNS